MSIFGICFILYFLKLSNCTDEAQNAETCSSISTDCIISIYICPNRVIYTGQNKSRPI